MLVPGRCSDTGCTSSRRYSDAIEAWSNSVARDADDPVVWRNLAVAAFNALDDPYLAAAHYAHALKLAPDDARLLYESDQLAKRTGAAPASAPRTPPGTAGRRVTP